MVQLDDIPPLTPGESGKARYNGCVIEVRVPGYDSQRINLVDIANVRGRDRVRIELRRTVDQGAGNTISPTGYQAPRKAREEYARGLEALRRADPQECAAHMERALEQFAGYAAAQFALGEVRAGMGERAAARKAYEAAAAADASYVMPRIRLGRIAAEDTDWNAVVRHSTAVMDLAPGQFPEAYLLRGTAEYRLGNYAAAERFAREGLASKGDAEPQLSVLLAAVAGQPAIAK